MAMGRIRGRRCGRDIWRNCWQRSESPSFGAEGAQRVDLRGDGEDRRYAEEGCGIIWRDAEEEAFYGAGESERAGEPDNYADEREAHALAENHAQDFRGARADGHAHADFVSTLADRERHDSANTSGGDG